MKTLVTNIAYTYGGALVNGLALFLVNVILARSLSQDMFGTFTLSLLVLTTVAEMSDLGLNGGLARFAPYYIHNGQTDKLKQLVKTIWQWRIWMIVGLTSLGILFSGVIAQGIFGQPALTPFFRASFLGIGGVVLLGFVNEFLKASERFVQSAVLQIAKGVLRFLSVLVLVYLGVDGIFPYLIVYVGIPWVLFLVSFRVLPKQFYRVRLPRQERKGMHKQLAHFSFWLTVWSLSAILASRVDQAMISSMLSLEDVALYATAFQFVFVYTMLQQSISAVLSPKVSVLNTRQGVERFIWRVFVWVVPVVIGLTLCVYLSRNVFLLFFGDRYAAALPLYVILSISMVVGFLQTPFSFVPRVYNATHLIAFSGIVQLCANIFLNITFIPRFGVVGAAYTFLIGVVVSLLYNACATVYILKTKEITVV